MLILIMLTIIEIDTTTSKYHYFSCANGAQCAVSGSGIVATVFGATGFLGRYLVQQLGMLPIVLFV